MGIFNGRHKESNSPRDAATNPTAPYGVETLHPCPNADFDICFVHGLTGDHQSTWTADQETSPWPQKLLPSRISRARILTYGYDAYVVQKSAVSQNRLLDHARNLLIDLMAYRASPNTSSRPLIFVAHSMGGLVCKAAMLSSRENPEPHLRLLFTHTKGIVFLGTPHRGSWMAQWAKIPATLFGALKPANTSLLDILETDNQLLGSLQVQFWEMVRGEREAGRRLEVTCFYEERGLRRLNSNPVVSKESATQDGYHFGSIDANHMNMTKFSSSDENGFLRIVGELERWMQSSSILGSSEEGANDSSATAGLSTLDRPTSHAGLSPSLPTYTFNNAGGPVYSNSGSAPQYNNHGSGNQFSGNIHTFVMPQPR